MATRLTLFQRELQKLLRARTYKLRNAIWPLPGAPPKINLTSIEIAIDELCNLAEEQLVKSQHVRTILSENYDRKRQWHPKRGKGRGKAVKVQRFKKWYDTNISTQNYVYSFWKRKTKSLRRPHHERSAPSHEPFQEKMVRTGDQSRYLRL